MAMIRARPAGIAKFFLRLPNDVLRHASSGPTPVRKTRKMPIGIITLLKKGAPTVILYPRTQSESIGKRFRTIRQSTLPATQGY